MLILVSNWFVRALSIFYLSFGAVQRLLHLRLIVIASMVGSDYYIYG